MSESKLYPIRPLPRTAIVPLTRPFRPNMYENSKIFIMNPVFNVIIGNEKSQELEMCIICLENVIEAERIKPCNTCNTYMHEKCFIKYSESKHNKPLCTTCYKEIKLEDIDIDIDIEEENKEEIDEERNSRLREERIYRSKKIKKYLYMVLTFCICFGILILCSVYSNRGLK